MAKIKLSFIWMILAIVFLITDPLKGIPFILDFFVSAIVASTVGAAAAYIIYQMSNRLSKILKSLRKDGQLLHE